MAVEVGRMVGGWIKADRAKLNIPEKEKEGDGEEKQNETAYECSECGEKITDRIKQYSEKHFGAAYCYKCQKKHKAEYRG